MPLHADGDDFFRFNLLFKHVRIVVRDPCMLVEPLFVVDGEMQAVDPYLETLALLIPVIHAPKPQLELPVIFAPHGEVHPARARLKHHAHAVRNATRFGQPVGSLMCGTAVATDEGQLMVGRTGKLHVDTSGRAQGQVVQNWRLDIPDRESAPGFLKQFVDKVGGVGIAKNNPGKNEIQALTGATITSKAVTSAVNEALTLYETVKGGANNG